MFVRPLVLLVALLLLAACDQNGMYVSNSTRLEQSRWFIGVALVGLSLAGFAAWRIARDKRAKSSHGKRRKRH